MKDILTTLTDISKEKAVPPPRIDMVVDFLKCLFTTVYRAHHNEGLDRAIENGYEIIFNTKSYFGIEETIFNNMLKQQ